MKTKRSLYRLIFEVFGLLFIFFLAWLRTFSTGTPLLSSENPAVLYSTDKEDHLGIIFSEALQKAEKSIKIAVYTISDQKVIQTLRKKALEGIQVTVICDGKACQGLEKKLGNEIRLIKSTPKGLMHLKILIIDDDLVWIGSANMTGESLSLHGNLVAGFDSPALAEWLGTKLDLLGQGESKYFPQRTFLIGDQTLEVWLLPNEKQAVRRIRNLIRSAQKTIRIAMFTWTRLDFVNDLVSAQLRGVNVQVALDSNSSKGASLGVVKALRKGEIPLRVNTGEGLLHYKTMIIDNQILVNGSANWTKAAFRQNEDCFFVLSPLTIEQNEFLEEMWKNIIANSKL